MRATLYVVPSSHPCAAVARALELKGIPYRTFELPPGLHAVHQQLRFGRRTVPALKMGRLTTSGSREIMRALDIVRPEPPLLPPDTERRTRVLEAEEWGDQVLQAAARRIIWAALPHDPEAATSYLADAKLPMPQGLARRMIPGVAVVERKLNGITPERTQADLAALPGWLDRVDAWLADGTLGAETPNAADLQIASSVRLLATLEDLAPVLAGRPALEHAHRLFPHWAGRTPAGSLPPG